MANRRRGRLSEHEIEHLLNESEIEDFTPSDEDVGDPEYVPAPHSPDDTQNDGSESSEREEESIAVNSRLGRGSGQARFRQRGTRRVGGRGRSRGVGRRRGVAERGNLNSVDEPAVSGSIPANNWTVKEFHPRILNLQEPTYLPINSSKYNHFDYFKQYITDDLIKTIVFKTNQTAIAKTERSLNLTKEETYVYIGITLLMATINYPQMRMYWENKWRVAIIADKMSRNRFFQLRNAIKFVFDNDISQDVKDSDKLWKVRPLIDCIKSGCLAQPKEQCMSIDEMIIPFSGSCSIKQYCPGKPNPVGLKAFVLANPDGTVCMFDIYQGQTTYPNYNDSSFSLGEKAVLNLADSLVPGHVLYFDRYFTSEKLIDALESRGIKGTGTLMKNRIPHDIRAMLMDDKQLKLQGRGSYQVIVRNDEKLAVTKWFDNKGVLFLSSAEGDVEEDECRRWCKKTKRFITIKRPRIVKRYNQKMGGVDMADRLLAVCPYRYRTKKWTQRFFSHMVDLGVSNSWLQYRAELLRDEVPVKKILQLRAFKMELGEMLIEANTLSESEDEEVENIVPPIKRRGKPTNPLPSKRFRAHGATHLPELVEKVSRCRQCHYNRTHIKCRACEVFLCLTKVRNCFVEFHQDI